MLKVNLEKTLLRQNKKVHSPLELLEIKEYDKLGDSIIGNLEKVFPNMPAISGKVKKEVSNSMFKQTNKFPKQRVFHISQIEKVCNNFLLRFLPTSYYCGSLDSKLTTAVSEFEISNNVKLNARNSYIAAPKSSFRLETKPKDPLFFYKINDEYYYLIHKWGNDLSIFRIIQSLAVKLLSSRIVIPLIFFITTTIIVFNIDYGKTSIIDKILGVGIAYALGCLICCLFCLGYSLIMDTDEAMPTWFIDKHSYDSKYI